MEVKQPKIKSMHKIVFKFPGQWLDHFDKQYTKVKTIAKGGFGDVILVRSNRDKQNYVAKINRKAKNDGVAAIEQTALDQLIHPNIVQKKEAFWSPW